MLDARTVCVTPLRQNCTILFDNRKNAILVDPGGDAALLLKELEGMHVEAILLTHGHLDHAGGAGRMKEALTVRQKKDVPVFGPTKEDDFLLRTITNQAAAFGLSGMDNVTPDRFLEDGEKLSLLEHEFEVAHIPGHTPGHIVFIDRKNARAIVGDTLFRGTIGRTDFAYGNGSLLIRSIIEKILPLPDETVILCGHGLPTTVGEEKKSNPYLNQNLAY